MQIKEVGRKLSNKYTFEFSIETDGNSILLCKEPIEELKEDSIHLLICVKNLDAENSTFSSYEEYIKRYNFPSAFKNVVYELVRKRRNNGN